MSDLSFIAQQLQESVKKSDQIIMDAFRTEVTREWKNDGHFAGSVVTATDKAVDTFLRQELARITPQGGFFTEETEENSIKEYTWIIDPIDGTANFANKIPVFGTLISLWRENEPQIGLISFPTFNEVIISVKNEGVRWNGEHLLYKKGLQNTQPYSIVVNVGTEDEKAKLIGLLDGIIFSPANFYSTAVHTGLLVTQRADIGIINNLCLWDIAAGVAIAKEAGLGVEFLSGWPDIVTDLRENNHQVVIGDNDLVKKVVQRIQG